jgi:hypothetical protein
VADDADILAPGSGLVVGRRATARAAVLDAALDARAALLREGRRLDAAAARAPRRRVLVLAVERTDVPNLLGAARHELARSRHAVTVVTRVAGGAGKFANLNALLAEHPAGGHDWLIVLDDDVTLPPRFLDRFLLVGERFRFTLVQPAHRHRSHAAWPITRRHPAIARRTRFVEIGPVTAFARAAFDAMLPFPDLRMGWGLDAHWAAVAQERGWSVGVVDATPIRHRMRRTASGYAQADAVAEARAFLADRPHLTAAKMQETLVTYRGWTPGTVGMRRGRS